MPRSGCQSKVASPPPPLQGVAPNAHARWHEPLAERPGLNQQGHHTEPRARWVESSAAWGWKRGSSGPDRGRPPSRPPTQGACSVLIGAALASASLARWRYRRPPGRGRWRVGGCLCWCALRSVRCALLGRRPRAFIRLTVARPLLPPGSRALLSRLRAGQNTGGDGRPAIGNAACRAGRTRAPRTTRVVASSPRRLLAAAYIATRTVASRRAPGLYYRRQPCRPSSRTSGGGVRWGRG